MKPNIMKGSILCKMVTLYVAVLLSFASTPAWAVLIDFEGLENGTTVTTQFPEATFSSIAGFENAVSTQPGIGAGVNFICTRPVGGFIDCNHDTIVTFTNPVNNLTFLQVGDNASGVVAMVDVFQGGVLAATVNILGDNVFNTPNLVDLTAFSNVTSIRIHSITDPGGLGWDNFSFNVGAVPVEPFEAISSQVLSQAGGCGTVTRILGARGRTQNIILTQEQINSGCITTVEDLQITVNGVPVPGSGPAVFVGPDAQVTFEGSHIFCWASTTTGSMTCVKTPPH